MTGAREYYFFSLLNLMLDDFVCLVDCCLVGLDKARKPTFLSVKYYGYGEVMLMVRIATIDHVTPIMEVVQNRALHFIL